LDFRYPETRKEDPSVVADTFAVVSKLANGLQSPTSEDAEFGSGIFRYVFLLP